MKTHMTIVAAAIVLAGCGSGAGDHNATVASTAPGDVGPAGNAVQDSASMTARSAVAHIKTADGKDVGTATVTETDGVLQLVVDATGMPAGTHGIHVHTTGKCEGPKFTSAGAHWNPMAKLHGTQNPKGPHAGDIPNLMIAADGSGKATATLPAGTIAGLLDADGSALVIHAKPDDYKTDPSGDSGDRIACGVFAANGSPQ